MPPLAPAAPTHTLRTHAAPISALHVARDNARLYVGDADGRVSCTDTRTLRPRAVWDAHTKTGKEGKGKGESLLGVEEWDGMVITHGRDNKLRLWSLPNLPSRADITTSAALPTSSLPAPDLKMSMDVNALNYCRFSLLDLSIGKDGRKEALVALPNLVESELADIWLLTSQDRLDAAIGKAQRPSTTFSSGNAGRGDGIIMSMHLYTPPAPAVSSSSSTQVPLRLFCAYESGSVVLFSRKSSFSLASPSDGQKTIEGRGWDVLWSWKSKDGMSTNVHKETVMGTALLPDRCFTLSVSADHFVGKYDLAAPERNEKKDAQALPTKQPGNASIALRSDGRVCAVGGWDGKIRLFTTRTLRPLGTLAYHRGSVQAVMFFHSHPDPQQNANTDEASDESDDEDEGREREERQHWVVGGGQDGRVSIWVVDSFEKK